MTAAKVSTEIPRQIAEGLESGIYERIGGAIREVDTLQIIAWLREAYELGEPVVSEVLSLSSSTANANALNLALSTMQFAVVMKRLGMIEKQLRQAKEVLDSINYKIDLSFYANFRAALDLATNAFTMANRETRQVSAMQAINRFLEAEHHYTDLVDQEIANQSQVVDDYLYTLSLAYVTEVRCYLELDELDTALQRLQEGLSVLRPRFETHTWTLLTANPAAYLHPSLSGQIPLKRLTAVYRWLTPGMDETAVFEAQRDNLFQLAQDPGAWAEALPPAVRLPVKGSLFSAKLFNELAEQLRKPGRLANLIGVLPGRAGAKVKVGIAAAQKAAPALDGDIFARLPETLALIELMIEQCGRFETYLAELKAVRQSGMTFQDWQALAPKGKARDAQVLFVTLSQTRH